MRKARDLNRTNLPAVLLELIEMVGTTNDIVETEIEDASENATDSISIRA